jgi:phosphopantothenoylcysteine decarboxylase/phosphopantothenate--cysteine ligase
MSLQQKNIILAMSGSIAAYKSPDIVRRLREQGANVRVVMSQGAQAFITPLTLQAVSGAQVHGEILDPAQESAFGHIDLARWADVMLIAPASANTLAKLAHGLADNLVSALALATQVPIVVAPAMNRQMWAASATQANCQTLRKRGVYFLGPADGVQACGEVGSGRMLEALEIVQALAQLCQPQRLKGLHVLINAGPTREDIDPVRFISNRSSGRMGYAIAAAAHAAGANVTLISGPVCLEPPPSIIVQQVYSARDMHEAVIAQASKNDIFIATAAVADYRPAQQATHKIKKTAHTLAVPLERTDDILASLGELADKPFTVGFAAETDNLIGYAQDKLQRKKLDMIAANPVGLPGQGFDSAHNALHVFWPGGEQILAKAPKTQLAHQLIELIATRFHALNSREE